MTRELPTDPATFDYEGIKQLAADLGRPSSTLIALAPGNDPFYCGPARQALARWFADQIWPLHDPEAVSVHVRRLHSALQHPVSRQWKGYWQRSRP